MLIPSSVVAYRPTSGDPAPAADPATPPTQQEAVAYTVSLNDPDPAGWQTSMELQADEWRDLHAGAAGSVLKNEYNQNIVFLDHYGPWADQSGRTEIVEARAAWKAYLNWLSGVDDGFSNGFGWSGYESGFFGYAGWWNNYRKTPHFNLTNLQGLL